MPPKKRSAPSASKAQPKAKALRTTNTTRSPKSTSKTTSKPKSSTKPNPKQTTAQSKPQPQSRTPQIRAAFTSYADATKHISTDDVSRALRALGYPLPPADFFDAEQEEEGLGWEEFRELAETLASTMGDSDGNSDGEGDSDADFDRMEEDALDADDDEDHDDEDDEDDGAGEEINAAFTLFTQFQPQYANLTSINRRITIQDLARIAKELKEDVDESVLRIMIEEANGEGGWKKGVGIREFESVLRRAGAVG